MTKGTKAARKIRKRCNKLTREQKDVLYEFGVKIISGVRRPPAADQVLRDNFWELL